MLTDTQMLQAMHFRSSVALQVTLDQDYNVPDNKSDIEKVIVENGEIQIQNIKTMPDKMILKGSLFWRIAYLKDRQNCTLDHMEGELPFEEVVNMDGLTEEARIRVDCEMEDLRVTMIHSRKVSVRSVVNVKVHASAVEEIPVVSEISDTEKHLCLQRRTLDVSGIAVRKKDTIRIREEMTLPGNKANMLELIWGEVQNRRVDIRPQDDKLLLRGEASVFCLYSGENEENPFEYAEADLAEMVLEIDLEAYEEKKLQTVSDVYSLKRQLVPVYQEAAMRRVCIRNQTECKLYEKVRMPGEHAGVLQLCHPWAEIRMDRLELTEEGIRAEGVADVHILYVNEDDHLPLDIAGVMIPFACMIETGILPKDVCFEVQPYLDQISAVMAGGDTAEVKMTVRLDTLVCQYMTIHVMTEISEGEANDGYMESLPNMTGYVVKKGDTLFSLGKQFCTTAQEIRRLNHIEKEEISEGERLLIMKQMSF